MASLLQQGAEAPRFIAPTIGGSSTYSFETVGGLYVLMLFYGTAARPQCQEALKLVEAKRTLFDDQRACFFGVTIDRADRDEARVAPSLPGIRHFLDADRAISRNYGVMFSSAKGEVHRPGWMLFDTTLRLVEYRPLDQGEAIFARLEALLAQGEPQLNAPALIIPRVFEPALCRELIALYEGGEPQDSGFMIESSGKTVGKIDYRHKRRSDCKIEDMELRQRIRERLARSVVPMIKRAYQFDVTRIERWIVACYDSEVGGYFNRHRDNTTSGTAHRQFACTINLNAEEYEGGELRFPEFGSRTFRAPTGGAVIFSCSLLHEATPVTSGRRYAFLPFFYNEAGAAIRTANNPLLSDEVSAYRSPIPAYGKDSEAA